jgi:glycogen synthase
MMRHRILLLTENYSPARGGMAESCDRIVRNLGSCGVGIDLLHFDDRVSRFTAGTTLSGTILKAPVDADPAHALNCAWNRVRAEVPVEETTHVVAFGGSLPLLGAPVYAAWMRRSLVVLCRGNEIDAGVFSPRRRHVVDEAIRRANAVCTVTEEQREKIEALYDREAICIGNGIDFDLWQWTEADCARGHAWREANVDPSRRVVGLFGHLKEKKGVRFFLEAALRAGAAERLHFVLVGEVDPLLAEWIGQQPLHCSIVTAVDRFALLPWFAAVDLVAIPSHYDGCPNVLVEAMALGIGTIGSAVGGMRDLVADGESGFLFRPTDDDDCARAIRSLIAADDGTLRRIGARASEIARERCDARDEANRYAAVLDATAQLPRRALRHEHKGG